MAFSVGRLLPAPLRRQIDAVDVTVDRWFDRLRGREAADRVFYGASELGDFALIWALLGTAQGLRDDVAVKRAVRLGVALAIESALVNGLLKSVVRRERPHRVGSVSRRLRLPRTSSFPSGHASSAFAAATLLSEGEGKALTAGYHAVAAVVASSRVYVRIHYASDVLVGAVVGRAYGRFVRRRFPLVDSPAADSNRSE